MNTVIKLKDGRTVTIKGQASQEQIDQVLGDVAKQPAPSPNPVSSDDTPDTPAPKEQGFLEKAARGVWGASQKVGGVLQSVGMGMQKGALSTVKSVEDLGSGIGDKMADSRVGKAVGKTLVNAFDISKEEASSAQKFVEETKITEEQVTPEGALEKLGFGAEQLAELFVPAGSAMGVGKLTSKLPAAVRISKGLQGMGVASSVAEKAARFVEGGLKIGAKAVGEGFDVAAKRTVQTGNVEESIEEGKTAALLSSAFQIGGKVLNIANKDIRKAMENANISFGGERAGRLRSRIDDASAYLADNPIVGGRESRLAKMNGKIDEMEDVLSDSLKAVSGEKGFAPVVNVKKFIGEKTKDGGEYVGGVLDDVAEEYRGTNFYQDAINEVKKIKKNIAESFGDDAVMTFDDINKFKRSLWKGSYNKAGLEVADEIGHEAGSIFKNQLDDLASKEGFMVGGKPFREFLDEYGRALNARKFLKIASSKSDIGLAMKLLTGGVGASVAGPAGILAGSTVQALQPMTRIRSALVAGLKALGDKPSEDAIASVFRSILAGETVTESGTERQ